MEKRSPDSVTTMTETTTKVDSEAQTEIQIEEMTGTAAHYQAVESVSVVFASQISDSSAESGREAELEFALPEANFIEDAEELTLHSEAETIPGPTAEPELIHDLIRDLIRDNGELLDVIEHIPSKMAFKIGEAADLVGVKQYVLRYWETEFEQLRPKKSKNNQRVYSRRDVETALMIKKLLYTDRFSIEGARGALRNLKNQVKEEKEMKHLGQGYELACQKLSELVRDIRRAKEILTAN